MNSWTSANSVYLQPRRHGSIKRRVTSRSRRGIFRFYSALMKPHLECCVQLWGPQYKKVMDMLESIGGHKDGERAGMPLLLRQSGRAGVIHPEKGLQGNLIAAFQYFKGACEKEGEQLFAWADSNRRRGNHFN